MLSPKKIKWRKPQKGNMIADDKIEESPDDTKFNTEKHHKRQHKF